MFRKTAASQTPPASATGDRMRFERNARIFASDGPVGTLRKVVVDEHSGEITMLVVGLDDNAAPILVPAGLLSRNAGSALFLTVNRSQFARAAARAARFDMASYQAANVKQTIRSAATQPSSRLPLLGSAGKDVVEAILPAAGDSAPVMDAPSPAPGIAAAPPAEPEPDDQPARKAPVWFPKRQRDDDATAASGN